MIPTISFTLFLSFTILSTTIFPSSSFALLPEEAIDRCTETQRRSLSQVAANTDMDLILKEYFRIPRAPQELTEQYVTLLGTYQDEILSLEGFIRRNNSHNRESAFEDLTKVWDLKACQMHLINYCEMMKIELEEPTPGTTHSSAHSSPNPRYDELQVVPGDDSVYDTQPLPFLRQNAFRIDPSEREEKYYPAQPEGWIQWLELSIETRHMPNWKVQAKRHISQRMAEKIFNILRRSLAHPTHLIIQSFLSENWILLGDTPTQTQ